MCFENMRKIKGFNMIAETYFSFKNTCGTLEVTSYIGFLLSIYLGKTRLKFI